MLNNYNEIKDIKGPYKEKISDNLYIMQSIIKIRESEYIEISLLNNENETFIGRFEKENYNLEFSCSNENLIIYYSNFIRDIGMMKVIKVLSLYNILDDTFYALTEKEALKFFNSNVDTNYLIDPNNTLVRSDIEKKRKLR